MYVPTGITDEGLRRRLQPWQAVRLLDFRNLIPGTFGGFTSAAAARAVDDAAFPLFADKSWCCSGEQPIPVAHIEWQYILPAKLQGRLQPPETEVAPFQAYPVPRYERPLFCDGLKTDKVNAKFLLFNNHPCTYLNMGIDFPPQLDRLLA